MNSLSCHDVLDQIDLYAAGECGAPEQSAIRQHLAHCPGCSQSEQEARKLLGLLELRLREPDGLNRLQARLQAEKRQSRPINLLPFARRAAAMAAMLLVAVGLSVWFRAQEPAGGPRPLLLAWTDSGRAAPVGVEHKPAIALFKADDENSRVYDLNLNGKTAKDFQEKIMANKQPLPKPPLVNLGLELRNATDKKLTIHVGAKGTELMLDLTGPGVLTRTTANSFGADFLIPKTITLEPGQAYRLPITRLVSGSRERILVSYWTQPGEYTLRLRYKVPLAPAPKGAISSRENLGFVTLRSAPLKILVR